ncbi:ABC transporter permease [Ramlibacter sp. Leaf400]|uniref:ABC transporter permease n=1 Tax=Ramlibacter sp. Leaf400 TaxID=1736365 RepID=UPI0006F461E2|nr:FtsX family ABC transporter permease [Ramlibacter sp. Leaf400]KQT10843.1 ABC transporter permease [Ramlibacter sp. Leaf400]
MRALDRKVLRDLRLLWSQAITIALVVASGIGGFLATLSAVDSLAQARDGFYASGRFADVFATVKRAPAALAPRLAEIPGVVDVQATVETFARVTVPGSTDPVIGQLIGLDADRPQRLNRVLLRSGRWPEGGSRPGGELDAVVTESFADAHGLGPGETVSALVNGKRRTLRITGTALSPEYIFGGLFGMPDLRAFGVFWVDHDELAAATDMAGAFNRVALKLSPQASQDAVLAQLTRRLAGLGGEPPHGRDEQGSHAMLDNEIREQRVLGTVLPAIFLAVAGFLLHVVTARLVATQREQVAALKALGYRDAAIAAHYLKLVAPMVLGGFVLGIGLGHAMGTMLTGLYADFFRFPRFDFGIPPGLVVAGLALVVATAVLGTLTAIQATVRLSAAQAMRPPSPGSYRRALLERLPRLRLAPSLRMILRNLERRPLRAAVTIGGMAAATAIVIMGNFFRDAIETIVETQFGLAMRGDLIVWTTDPVDAAAGRELARLPGVLEVEPGRRIAVRFVHGSRSQKGLVDAYPAVPSLQRVVDVEQVPRPPGVHGLLMTDRLARKLGLEPGDTVTVEVREGRRAVLRLVVERTVRDMMGMNAFIRRDTLNRALGDGDLANFFSLRAGPGAVERVLETTQGLPKVAGAFSKATMLRNMQEVSARNILIMSSVLTAFAAVIAVGVVYNNARIALAERTWELASLRVLGFTRGEVSVLLLGELALGIAIALPLGMLLGWGLTHGVVQLMRSDQFLFPVVIRPRTYAWAALCVVAAGLASALVVRRRIDSLDMVAALKTRE